MQIRSRSRSAAHAGWGKQLGSVVLYLAAIAVAFYRPIASLALIGLVAVIWLLPPRWVATGESDADDSTVRIGKSRARKG
jgi:uncharacterized membrane protein HdeD (DUF308 family)